MQTAKAMAELNYLEESVCQMWIDSHKKTYPVFHTWVEEQAHLATCRGWSANSQGRIRWVNEDNAKAQGASPARSAVNHQIQSQL